MPTRLRQLELGLPTPGREVGDGGPGNADAGASGRYDTVLAEIAADIGLSAEPDHPEPEADSANADLPPSADLTPADLPPAADPLPRARQTDTQRYEDDSDYQPQKPTELRRDPQWQDPYAANPGGNGHDWRDSGAVPSSSPVFGPWTGERAEQGRSGRNGSRNGNGNGRAEVRRPERDRPDPLPDLRPPAAERERPDPLPLDPRPPAAGRERLDPLPDFRPPAAGRERLDPLPDFRPPAAGRERPDQPPLDRRPPGADRLDRRRPDARQHDTSQHGTLRPRIAEADALRSDGPRSDSPRSDSPRSGAPRSGAPRSDSGRLDLRPDAGPDVSGLHELVEQTLARCRAAEGRTTFGSYGSSGLTPAMHRLAAQLPVGGLAPGSEADSLKTADRFTVKLSRLIARNPTRSPEDLAETISDAVRYAFAFELADYTEGTWLVHRKLKAHGFELEARRNLWPTPERKGIFTRWRDPAHGIAFEVQFHTVASWSVAKRTHDAYVRITDPATPPSERAQLRARQVAAAASAGAPPGCMEIADFRPEPR